MFYYITSTLVQVGTGCETLGLVKGLMCDAVFVSVCDCSAQTDIQTNLTVRGTNQDAGVNMNPSSCPKCNKNFRFICLSAEHRLRTEKLDRPSLWLFRKTHETKVNAVSGWGQSHKFDCLLSPSIQITDLSLIVCSHNALLVFLTFCTQCSLIFYEVDLTEYFTRCMIFLQSRELWKVWCLLLSAGFLFTPLCPDSLLTLQFTLCGKQDRTLCWLSFQLAWIQTTNQT